MAATDPTRLPDDLRGVPEHVTIANINADPGRRQRKADVTPGALAELLAGKPRAHWMNVLEQNDVPFAPVHGLQDVLDDPQVRHLGTFYRQYHPTEGEITAVHRPVLIDGAREQRTLPAPTLGEHTDEVLAELGYDRDRIAELRAASVI